MEVQVVNFSQPSQHKTIQVSDVVFAAMMNGDLVHQIVTAHRNAQRQGAPDRKNRSDVSGSTIKPWRQKGTGRARAGSRRVHCGVVVVLHFLHVQRTIHKK